MGKPTIEQIKQIVAVDNPKLMILTDDVYGTFVPLSVHYLRSYLTIQLVSILILNTLALPVGVWGPLRSAKRTSLINY